MQNSYTPAWFKLSGPNGGPKTHTNGGEFTIGDKIVMRDGTQYTVGPRGNLVRLTKKHDRLTPDKKTLSERLPGAKEEHIPHMARGGLRQYDKIVKRHGQP